MTATRRYRAFISYSHRDASVASWLHRALERYRVPKALRDRSGDLRPIFRDRDELTPATSLTAEVRRALGDSDALIVVCSPHARASHWVDQEIRLFAALGRANRIFCLLVDGFNGFPLALGDVGIDEPLAADARRTGDGKTLAKLKLAAGLLGVGFDELLNRDRVERQRTFVRRGAAFAAAMAGAAGLTLWVGAADPCPDPIERMTGTWDATTRQRIEDAFARSDLVFAATARTRVGAALDGYSTRWREMHVEACEATHVEGRQSDEMLDRRMACLSERLHDLRATAELLAAADDAVVERAVDITDALRPLERCEDVDALRSAYPPPPMDRAATIDALRQRLARVMVMADAGRYRAAVDAASALLPEVEASGYPPLIAETLLALGRAQVEASDPALVATLERAALLGAEARDDELVANGWLALTLGLSQELDALDRARTLMGAARASVARLGARHPLNATLASQEGAIAYRSGDLLSAKAAFTRAVELARPHGARYLGPALTNLATVEKDLAEYERARDAAEEAHSLAIARFGEEHPSTTEPMMTLGAIAEGSGRLEEALGYYEHALAIREAAYGPDNLTVALSLRAVGWVQKELGRYEEARVALERTLRLYLEQPETPRFHLASVHNALGDLAMYRGELDTAEQSFREAVALWESYGDDTSIAIPLSNLGALLNRRGDFDAARGTCERVRLIDERSLGIDHPDYAFSLTCLGEALIGLGQANDALPLLAKAVALRATGKPWELGWSTFQLARATYPRDPTEGMRLARSALELMTRELSPDPYWLETTQAWLAGRSQR